MHNSPRLMKGNDRCTLLMHPADARARNLQEGQEVEVSSNTGAIQLKLEMSEEMMPGVISIPHGWGHHLEGTRLQVAHERAGVNVNELTSNDRIDAPTGNAVFNGLAVEVTAIS
jgi:anaerobic selenocysteine-containing dehydrogenase